MLSQFAVFGKRVKPASGNDQVVQYTHFHQAERITQ
jgi:hypothetical protein